MTQDHLNDAATSQAKAPTAEALVRQTATAARLAQRSFANATRARKDQALETMAVALEASAAQVLAANALDLEHARQSGMKPGLLDRLALDESRIHAMADSLREVAALPDPVGAIVAGRTLPNGLRVRQQRVPLGVVGMIYEARPNVTVEVAALTIKSGNAVVLRGGSAAQASNAAIVAVLRSALVSCGLPAELISTVDEAGREGAHALMHARGLIDVLVPRGGAGLIATVVEESKVPVIETGSGNCHIYVDSSADQGKAVEIIVNAKIQRVGVCNAAETLLVHHHAAGHFLPLVAPALWERGVTLHADEATRSVLAPYAAKSQQDDLLVPATAEDWDTEYGSLDLAVRVVDTLEEAINHIRLHTTGHTEAVLAQDVRVINTFIAGMDSAAVMVNASTRFTDGGQLGLGAELGISTQKLHARGPMGLSALTSTTWVVEGEGHIRP
ncbi:Gamma-glutamyl phosphate reductase [Actinomyces bovis]|uniref:Gamma-glutamyl phosphate reductase n=1 Tax=Actinomyces bovis TaxID=1658 RepID=A0ABY1VKD3_9ACTO|nr:glutamate-5-semialdehyde dehydrogenase [Actinomyces bovis]SPT52564.1 Gamma-glutamyl phosphate reductase [Actinomyces bovis]VEG54339.1 Gamma-glutamyl phosphate reductase [Actinomyces israelii]